MFGGDDKSMITGFHHIALLISSEECLDFYKDVLGFTESFRKQRANDCIVFLDGYGLQLEIFIDNRHPGRVLDLSEPLGTRHFALKVDDLETALAELKVSHADIGSDWTGIRYCYITDPDGNQIELHE